MQAGERVVDGTRMTWATNGGASNACVCVCGVIEPIVVFTKQRYICARNRGGSQEQRQVKLQVVRELNVIDLRRVCTFVSFSFRTQLAIYLHVGKCIWRPKVNPLERVA